MMILPIVPKVELANVECKGTECPEVRMFLEHFTWKFGFGRKVTGGEFVGVVHQGGSRHRGLSQISLHFQVLNLLLIQWGRFFRDFKDGTTGLGWKGSICTKKFKSRFDVNPIFWIVWCSPLWSEGPKTHQNLKVLVSMFIPWDLEGWHTDVEVPWRRPSRSKVWHPLRSHGDKLCDQNVQVLVVFGPPDQNELYHTP